MFGSLIFLRKSKFSRKTSQTRRPNDGIFPKHLKHLDIDQDFPHDGPKSSTNFPRPQKSPHSYRLMPGFIYQRVCSVQDTSRNARCTPAAPSKNTRGGPTPGVLCTCGLGATQLGKGCPATHLLNPPTCVSSNSVWEELHHCSTLQVSLLLRYPSISAPTGVNRRVGCVNPSCYPPLGSAGAVDSDLPLEEDYPLGADVRMGSH